MPLKECMKKKKPYMVHEEAIGGVDGCPSSQPFLHCEKGLCEQDDKGRSSTWTSLCTYCWNQPMPAPDDIPKQCCRCKISGVPLMKSANEYCHCCNSDCDGTQCKWRYEDDVRKLLEEVEESK